MSKWTLTPDGLKTDEQLADEQWHHDYFRQTKYCSDRGCSTVVVRAPAGMRCVEIVAMPSFGAIQSCPAPAAVCCSAPACGNAWCKEHAE